MSPVPALEGFVFRAKINEGRIFVDFSICSRTCDYLNVEKTEIESNKNRKNERKIHPFKFNNNSLAAAFNLEAYL